MSATSHVIRLLFAGGGTGGHLYPAVAIADRISELLRGKHTVNILFVGTKRGLEYRIRETLGYPLWLINVRGLARSFTLKNLLVPFLLLGALIKTNSLINRFQPHLVVGTGGYVSLPVLKIAAAKGITTVVQEQNSYPGLSTRKLSPSAERVYLGFVGAQKYIRTRADVVISGNPVRSSVLGGNRAEALKTFSLDPDKKTVLVLGGSQGARSINNAVLRCLNTTGLPIGYQLLWQTGKRDYKDVIAQAGDKAVSHALFPFENRMDLVYAATDLAVARAGALTLAELQACRIPAILIPYPYAAGDHQTKNAQQFVESGFAEMITQSDLDRTDPLQKAVAAFESGLVVRMRENLEKATIDKKPAVDIIAEGIINLLKLEQVQEGSVDT